MSATGIRPRQVAVWLLLGVLIIGIVVVERASLFGPYFASHGDDHDRTEATMLLPLPPAELGVIEIAKLGKVYRFERDDDGAWFYHDHGHDQGGADDHHAHDHVDQAHHHHDDGAERIQTAFAALGRARVERQLESDRDLGEYGVEKPALLINVYGDQELQPLARYAVGDIAPDTVSRYIMAIDKGAVMTIPNYQIENLLALIEAVTVTNAVH